MNNPEEIDAEFLRKRHLQKQRTTAATQPAAVEHEFQDTVPDVPFQEDAASQALKDIQLMDAFKKWFPNLKIEKPGSGGKPEETLVECPMHNPEKNPSCSINTVTQEFTCYHIQQGGTLLKLALIKYPRFGHGKGKDYFNLRDQILSDFHIKVGKTPSGKTKLTSVVVVDENDDTYDNVTDLPIENNASDLTLIPKLDFEDIIPKGDNFLRAWMQETSKDYVSPYFYFFNGLIMLAMAAGRNVRLRAEPPIHANINVCLVGRSATGKSRSQNPMFDVLYSSDIVWEHIQGSNSGEDLVDAFVKTEKDATGKVVGYVPVRGLVDYYEFSEYVTAARRNGSKLESVVIQMYDTSMTRPLTTRSRGAGVAKAKHFFGCMISTTQDKSMRHLLTKEQSNAGSLNRMVYVVAPPVEREAMPDITFNLDHCVTLLNKINEWAKEEFTNVFGEVIHEVQWERDARARLKDFIKDRVFPTQDAEGEDEDDFLNRMDLLLMKLALLFSINMKRKTIEMDCVENAIKMFDYLVFTYGVPQAQMHYSEENALSDSIVEAIRNFKNPKRGPTVSELQKEIDPKKRIAYGTFLKVIKLTVELGRIKEVPWVQEGRGRPPKEGVTYSIVA